MQQGVLLGVASKKTAFINERHWKRQLLLQSMPWGSMSLSVPSPYCSGFPASPSFLRLGDGAYVG